MNSTIGINISGNASSVMAFNNTGVDSVVAQLTSVIDTSVEGIKIVAQKLVANGNTYRISGSNRLADVLGDAVDRTRLYGLVIRNLSTSLTQTFANAVGGGAMWLPPVIQGQVVLQPEGAFAFASKTGVTITGPNGAVVASGGGDFEFYAIVG